MSEQRGFINRNMTEVVSADFSKQNLVEIPYSKIKLDSNWVILSDNKIKRITKEIKNFRSITRLALNDNRIEEIEGEIGDCVGISWIDLTRNKLKSLPAEIGNLTRISGLGLSENEFDEIPECIYKLKNLRKFGFFSNRISLISPTIKNLRSLVKLDLSNNRISELPPDFCTLTNLCWLNLSNNKLKRIPDEINNLKKLEELGLGINELVSLPNMSNLNMLRILPVFKNKLKTVHPSLFFIKSIEKLDFSDNEITVFPYDALKSNSLKYLNLRNNCISEISTFQFDDCRSNINMLDISENKLKYLPLRFLKCFITSTSIRIGMNPFEKLPSKIPQEQSLLQICFTKILNDKCKVVPWIDRMFERHYVCEQCRCKFVLEPCFYYSVNYIERESQFVSEKMVCSIRCLRIAENIKTQ